MAKHEAGENPWAMWFVSCVFLCVRVKKHLFISFVGRALEEAPARGLFARSAHPAIPNLQPPPHPTDRAWRCFDCAVVTSRYTDLFFCVCVRRQRFPIFVVLDSAAHAGERAGVFKKDLCCGLDYIFSLEDFPTRPHARVHPYCSRTSTCVFLCSSCDWWGAGEPWVSKVGNPAPHALAIRSVVGRMSRSF